MNYLFIILAFIFLGCADKPVAASVSELAGDLKVAGFKKNRELLKILRINFDFNDYHIKPQYYDEIRELVQIIKNDPEIKKVEVVGYTDNLGDYEYNLELSLKRAEAVRDLLIDFGVDPDIIEARGEGENNPVAPNDTPEHRALNRRVEVIVYY